MILLFYSALKLMSFGEGIDVMVSMVLIPFVIIAPLFAVILWLINSFYKKEKNAFYLNYPEMVYQETACQYCGGISIYGMHNKCPHCGCIMPPAWGPIYLNEK